MNEQEQSPKPYDLSCLQDGRFEHVAIICHDQPDPDCLASAMAMKEIAESMNLKAAIYYGGEIAHTQNRVMINVFNIPIVKLDHEEDESQTEAIKTTLDNSYIVVVDTSKFAKDNCVSIEPFVDDDKKPDLVIDHHAFNPNVESGYIHRTYGSCSTIFVEIMQALDLEPSTMLATALYLGISKDTEDLTMEGTCDEDRNASERIKSRIDLDTYLKIFNYRKPKALLGLRQLAYNSMRHGSSMIAAHVGVVSSQQRALFAEICEELLAIEGIETAVVMAIVNEGPGKKKYLEASFRSSALAMDANEFMQKVFGKKYAGGRKGAGGAKIPLDPIVSYVLDDHEARDNAEDLICFIEKIFESYQRKAIDQKDRM